MHKDRPDTAGTATNASSAQPPTFDEACRAVAQAQVTYRAAKIAARQMRRAAQRVEDDAFRRVCWAEEGLGHAVRVRVQAAGGVA